MQQRAINVVLTAVTGSCLAGMLVAGVAAASDGDAAPKQKKLPSQQAMAVRATYNGRSAVGFIGDRGPGEGHLQGLKYEVLTWARARARGAPRSPWADPRPRR
jgi:hypothetical protein